MRRARIKVDAREDEAVYHLISRTVNGEWLLGPTPKEVLRQYFWQIADAFGLEILTYAILNNHFHLLVRVPQPAALSDEELLRRYAVLYPKPTKYQTASLGVIKQQLAENGPKAVEWRTWMLGLMYDVSQYMKVVKERFSIWFNKRHNRFGPVWSDRFTSVLIDPKCRAVEAVALYIDLNCVRAGIVKDPKDYRWCGYARAVGGGRDSLRESLRALFGGKDWSETQAAYRTMLFAVGATPCEGKASISLERVKEVLEQGGQLAAADVLRCRVRYFSQAAVLGGREFVESHLARVRARTGRGERMSVRRLPTITEWGELSGLRPIRRGAFG